MVRFVFAALLVLSGCIPAFEEATPKDLYLTLNGDALTLYSARPIVRGSIGLRAEAVDSNLCVPKGCEPDAEGRTLLTLSERAGETYGRPVRVEGAPYRAVALGRVVGLVRARVVVLWPGETAARVRTLEPPWGRYR